MLPIFAPLLLAAHVSDLGWLVGEWCTEPNGAARICEHWAPPEKGGMRP